MTRAERVWASTVGFEGSTRALAVIRIGTALVLWHLWGDSFLPFHADDWPTLALGVAFLVGSFGMLIGLLTPLSTGLTAACGVVIFYGVGVYGKSHDYVHHHTWLLVSTAVLLTFSPCGRSLSLDRALASRPALEHGPLWTQRLIAWQISMVYFWGAYDKSFAGWFRGDRMEHYWMLLYGTSDPVGPTLHLALQAAAIGTVVIEYFLAVGLWFPRLHRWLIPAAMAFHAMIYFFIPVASFTATMWLLFLAFVPPAEVHAFFDRQLGNDPEPARDQSLDRKE